MTKYFILPLLLVVAVGLAPLALAQTTGTVKGIAEISKANRSPRRGGVGVGPNRVTLTNWKTNNKGEYFSLASCPEVQRYAEQGRQRAFSLSWV